MESVRGRCDYGEKAQREAILMAFQMEEEGHQARNVGGLQNLGKARKQMLPRASRKDHSPVNALILAQ